jgi:hypothetical protein
MDDDDDDDDADDDSSGAAIHNAALIDVPRIIAATIVASLPLEK